FASELIENWRTARCDHAAHYQSGRAGLNIHIKRDLVEDWIIYPFKRRGIHLEQCGAWLGVQPTDDAQQRLALRRVRALVDNEERFSMSVMNRTRPCEYTGKSKTIKLRVAMMALIDLHANHRLAVPVRRQRIELWAAISTTAMGELPALDHPYRRSEV